MSAAQAKEVLNLEKAVFTKSEVMEQFQKYFDANDPANGGSFYLQSKIWNAKESLLSELGESETPTNTSDAAAESNSKQNTE